MTRPRQTVWLVLVTLALCAATHAHADEAKTYRWVGHDGRVYSTPTPPPKGAGTIIEVQSAKPKKAAPAPAPAAQAAPVGSLRRFLQDAAAAQKESRERAAAAAAMEEEISQGVTPGDTGPAHSPSDEPASPCSRHMNWVWAWRSADNSVRDAEAHLDNLQSDTRGFMTKYETSRLDRLDSAERRVEAAEDHLSQVESDATRAGVPSNCLTH